MDVLFLNCYFNVLISLLLIISVSGLPESIKYSSVRFPSSSNDEFKIYETDVSGEEKKIRSPTATTTAWTKEIINPSHDYHKHEHSNSRSDSVRNPPSKGSQLSDDDSKIIFPGQIIHKNKTNHSGAINFDEVPPCPNGKTFCVDAERYPVKLLKSVLDRDSVMFKNYFGRDVIPESDLNFRNRIPPTNDSVIQNRIDTNMALCEVQERVIFPKKGENAEGKWLFIVNAGDYIQGVRIEECVNPSSPCNSVASFPLGYKATCEQKYMYRKLLALNGSKAVPDNFRLPACCSCRIAFEGPESRMAPLPLTISPPSDKERSKKLD